MEGQAPLLDMYHCQYENLIDIRKSYQWLEKAGLKDITGALILTA